MSVTINIKCQTADGYGITYIDPVKVEQEDSGSITLVLDAWPNFADTTQSKYQVPRMTFAEQAKRAKHCAEAVRMRANELPPTTAPAIVGRTPTPWMFENRYNVRKEDFYDEALSEGDLRRIVEKRSNRSSDVGV